MQRKLSPEEVAFGLLEDKEYWEQTSAKTLCRSLGRFIKYTVTDNNIRAIFSIKNTGWVVFYFGNGKADYNSALDSGEYYFSTVE
jgi:hypothetical protein